MRVLHLLSNFKLTGPAEPALRLAQHLARRGHDVVVAHMPKPAHVPVESGLVAAAVAARGLATVPGLRLPKHFEPLAAWRDARHLGRLFGERRFDVVHCHLPNDHLTAALACGRTRSAPLLVRTNHDAVPLAAGLRNRWLLPRRTDVLIELSRRALETDVRRFRIEPDRVQRVETAIDLARFDPARPLPDLRAKLGLRPEHFVVGIAARVQRRRRFDVLLAAVARAHRVLPELRLVVIGRGTHREEVAVRPAQALGLGEVAIFPGYLRDDEYVGGLRALDVKVFLVPGTDGSCRAVREAMALGRPVLASRRGMLPELVTDELDGIVVEDTPQRLGDALVRLGRDADLRTRLGDAARRNAVSRFDPQRQAEEVEAVYVRGRS